MSVSLRKSSQSISVKWSASHMANNLTLVRLSDSRKSTIIGVSYKTGFAMVTIADDGGKQTQAQLLTRTIGSNGAAASDTDTRALAYVVQAAFVALPVRTVLVLACTKSIQIYEPDGGTNLHIHMLDKNHLNRTESSIYARGIAGVGQNSICVGNHQGEILVFSIAAKGTNIFLKETVPAHKFGITALVANADLLVSSDTIGMILVWNIQTMLQINKIDPTGESGVISLAMWNNCIVAAYANGMIHFYDPENAQLSGSITAHARSINAIDCNEQGLLASVGDDCFVRLWHLSGSADNLQISHECNYRIENSQLVGVKFLSPSRGDLAVSTYDSNEITVLRTS